MDLYTIVVVLENLKYNIYFQEDHIQYPTIDKERF